jgi:hypothetical protein
MEINRAEDSKPRLSKEDVSMTNIPALIDSIGRATDDHFAKTNGAILIKREDAVALVSVFELICEALKPFAALATEFMDDRDIPSKGNDRTVWGYNEHDLTYGDFRRALSSLRALSKQGDRT